MSEQVLLLSYRQEPLEADLSSQSGGSIARGLGRWLDKLNLLRKLQ
jgi:hypothetical protein